MRGIRAAALVLSVLGATGLVVLPLESEAASTPKPPKPSVTKLTPASGSVAGGVTVKLKGKNLAGAKKVLFGSTKGTQLKVKSAKKLTVVAPAHAAGAVDVFVVTKGGTSKKVKGDVFTYAATPTTPPSTPPTTPPTTPPSTPAGAAVAAPVPGGAAPNGSVTVRSVSCPATGECFAVGRFNATAGGNHPLLERLHAGSWTPTDLPLPPGANSSAEADLFAVDCPTTTFCAAAGVYRAGSAYNTALLETWDGTTWTPSTVAIPGSDTGNPGAWFSGLDCTSSTFCVAAGWYTDTSIKFQPLILGYDGTAWSVKTKTPPAGGFLSGRLLGLSCPAVGSCVAVGGYVQSANQDLPLVETLSGGSWTGTAAPRPAGEAAQAEAGLWAVSCPAAGSCTAIGSYESSAGKQLPLVDRLVSSAWTASTFAVPADAGDEHNPVASFTDISCPTIAYCAASGTDETGADYTSNQPVVATLSGSSATPTAAAAAVSMPGASSTPAAQLQRIVCPTSGGCAAVGRYDVPGPATVGLLARVSGGLQPGVRAPAPADAGTFLFFNGLDSDSTSTGVAVGGYIDTGGISRGLLATGVPIGPGFA